MTPEEELRGLFHAKEQIENKIEERDRLLGAAMRVTSAPSGMPHGGDGGDKISSAVAAAADVGREIEAMVAEYATQRQSVSSKIYAIEDRDLRMILKLRYLHFWKFRKIAAKMHRSEEYIYKKHRLAIKKYYLYSKKM